MSACLCARVCLRSCVCAPARVCGSCCYQVPQFILDDAIDRGEGGVTSIVCTQPRRISAIGVAERVCEERAQASVGGEVGYQIRLERRAGSGTRLLFCTTGILLRRIQVDARLDGVSHVVRNSFPNPMHPSRMLWACACNVSARALIKEMETIRYRSAQACYQTVLCTGTSRCLTRCTSAASRAIS